MLWLARHDDRSTISASTLISCERGTDLSPAYAYFIAARVAAIRAATSGRTAIAAIASMKDGAIMISPAYKMLEFRQQAP